MAKFKCGFCDKDCSTRASLSNHLKYKHPIETELEVPVLVVKKKKRGRPRKVVSEAVLTPSMSSAVMQVKADLDCRYCPGCGTNVDRFRKVIPGQFRHCPDCGFVVGSAEQFQAAGN